MSAALLRLAVRTWRSRQLTLAAQVYALDNNDAIPPNGLTDPQGTMDAKELAGVRHDAKTLAAMGVNTVRLDVSAIANSDERLAAIRRAVIAEWRGLPSHPPRPDRAATTRRSLTSQARAEHQTWPAAKPAPCARTAAAGNRSSKEGRSARNSDWSPLGATRRRREQALLRTRGASPSRIVRLATLEAGVTGIAGVVLGLLAAAVIGRTAFGTSSFGATGALSATVGGTLLGTYTPATAVASGYVAVATQSAEAAFDNLVVTQP